MIQIKYANHDGHQSYCQINKLPDSCPSCNKAIHSQLILAHSKEDSWDSRKEYLEAICSCPNEECDRWFIAYYESGGTRAESFFLRDIAKPTFVKLPSFSEIIEKMSKSFIKIYSQSFVAENQGLMEICGCGYRKALEYLIKDYLIKLSPDKEDSIKQTDIGNLICNSIKDENIKACAERATWLGNDETHYARKWEDKDLKNLKDLIDLTVRWIESAEITRQYIEEMPDKK